MHCGSAVHLCTWVTFFAWLCVHCRGDEVYLKGYFWCWFSFYNVSLNKARHPHLLLFLCMIWEYFELCPFRFDSSCPVTELSVCTPPTWSMDTPSNRTSYLLFATPILTVHCYTLLLCMWVTEIQKPAVVFQLYIFNVRFVNGSESQRLVLESRSLIWLSHFGVLLDAFRIATVVLPSIFSFQN